MLNNEINIRDPFVLTYDGKYYMYGTRGATCWGEADGFDVYIGEDLVNWNGPIEIFHNNGDFWANMNYWAPECHLYNSEFFLFASFKSKDRCRGTQILKSDNPAGPFRIHSDGPVTPADWECLDGTLYIDKEGNPYMVFCHEWVQVGDGEICAIKLTKDLKQRASEPKVLFKASEAPHTSPIRGGSNYVTDGPYLRRLKDGTLILLWSSFGSEGYTECVAISDNGEIDGKWIHQERPLFSQNGGHGMIFESLDNKLYLTLHSPNKKLMERPFFYTVEEQNGTIKIL